MSDESVMVRSPNSKVGAVPAGFTVKYHFGLLPKSISTYVMGTSLTLKARLARCVNGQSPRLFPSGEAWKTKACSLVGCGLHKTKPFR